MSLKYNKKDNSFVLISNDAKKAKSAGLTLSTNTRGPNGEKVWYTADYDKKPIYNPYAALPFFSDGDSVAKEKLQNMYDDYTMSWSKKGSLYVPKPDNGMDYMDYQLGGIEYASKHSNFGS
jgi:hypothetical protein